jgi:hypothetical protein
VIFYTKHTRQHDFSVHAHSGGAARGGRRVPGGRRGLDADVLRAAATPRRRRRDAPGELLAVGHNFIFTHPCIFNIENP